MKKIILSLASALSCLSVEAINIKLLKGTHTIVSEDYSPVMGLAFLENNILKQWYELSPYEINGQISKLLAQDSELLEFQKDAIIKMQQYIKNDDAVQKLLLNMFHIAGGSFNVTHAPNNPVMQLKPEHIGQILRVVHDWMLALKDPVVLQKFKDAHIMQLAQLKQHKGVLDREIKNMWTAVVAARKKLKTMPLDDQLSQIVEQYKKKGEGLNRLNTEIIKLTQINPKDAEQDFIYGKLKSHLLELVKNFNLKNKNKSFAESDWKPFVTSLVGSLQIQQAGLNQVYAENTAQNILLGYMLAISHDRTDLQDYFKGFLGASNFVLPEEKYTDQEIDHIIISVVKAHKFQQVADLLCAFIYKEKYALGLPKVVEDIKLVAYQGIHFPDCMETMMRNAVNIITYDQNSSVLGVVPSGLTMSPDLQLFYSKQINQDNASVGHIDVHQNWVHIVENIESVAYIALVHNGRGTKVHHVCEGVMPVAELSAADKLLPKKIVTIGEAIFELHEKKVNDKTYLLVPKNLNLYCCEMMPTPSNIIVLLNKLFQLRIYPSAQAVFESNFVLKYFESMCDKIGWSVDSAIIDQLDTASTIDIPIESKNGLFTIHLQDKAHANLTTESTAKTELQFETSDNSKQSQFAVALSSQLISYENLPISLQTICLMRNLNIVSVDRDKIGEIVLSKIEKWDMLSSADKDYLVSLIIWSMLSGFYDVFELAEQASLKSSLSDGLGDLFNIFLGGSVLFDITNNTHSIFCILPLMIDSNLIVVNKIGLIWPLIEKCINDIGQDETITCLCAILTSIINKEFIDSSKSEVILIWIKKCMNSDRTKCELSDLYPVLQSMVNKGFIDFNNVELIWSWIKRDMNDEDAGCGGCQIHLLLQSMINKGLIDSNNIDIILSWIEKDMSNRYFDCFRDDVMVLIGTLVNKNMITKSEIASLENAAGETLGLLYKQQLFDLKLRAPVSRTRSKPIQNKAEKGMLSRVLQPKQINKSYNSARVGLELMRFDRSNIEQRLEHGVN